jgi:hypothetical protein
MNRSSTIPGLLKPLRIGVTFLLCAGGAGILLLLGRPLSAAGVGLGFALHVTNLLFMAETARALVESGTRQRVAVATGLSSAGRLLLLGVILAVIGIFLGREMLLGACGGLLVAQVNLHVWGLDAKEMA